MKLVEKFALNCLYRCESCDRVGIAARAIAVGTVVWLGVLEIQRCRHIRTEASRLRVSEYVGFILMLDRKPLYCSLAVPSPVIIVVIHTEWLW